MIVRYTSAGGIRAVWPREGSDVLRAAGYRPARAGNINPVDRGPFAGFFFADLTALAEEAGRDDFRVCLYPPKPEYAEANAAEEEFVTQNYVMGDRS